MWFDQSGVRPVRTDAARSYASAAQSLRVRVDRACALRTCVVVLCALLATSVPALSGAQSQTERGENAWRDGTTYALQGNADSALASFRRAGAIAEAVHDSSLWSAALRGAAEVQLVYLGCTDSSLTYLRRANALSVPGDRTAGQVLVRKLALAGKVAEARDVQAALYADLKDEVPRTISRESIAYLSGQAAIQRASGQDAAAYESLVQARQIADRLSSGDAIPPNTPPVWSNLNSVNYWVTFETAQLMLTTKSRGVGSVAKGKELMDAVASASDDPEDGNAHRFSVFRLLDRLTVNAWRCNLRGEKCAVPVARKCP